MWKFKGRHGETMKKIRNWNFHECKQNLAKSNYFKENHDIVKYLQELSRKALREKSSGSSDLITVEK